MKLQAAAPSEDEAVSCRAGTTVHHSTSPRRTARRDHLSLDIDLAPARARIVVPGQPAGEASAADGAERNAAAAALLRAAIVSRMAPEPLPPAGRVAKRVLDVVGAALLLLVMLPALLATALAIKVESRGPVLFRQERTGRDGTTFKIVKFRSMVVGNDDSAHRAYVAALIAGEAGDADGVFKLVHDPRITKVGRTIRRFSLDELPQLWNVLVGDMSLVGPRPALPHEVELYDARARQRLVVKPGLTGLWQVSGRCELSFADMVELDVRYWQRWSLMQDLHILARTPFVALTGRGAA